MRTYKLTLEEAVGMELADKVRESTLIGTEHMEDIELTEPAYQWVGIGQQFNAIHEAIRAEHDSLNE